MEHENLVVDTDPGLDDALALSYLWQHHSIDLIATVAGNIDVKQATTNAAHVQDHHDTNTRIRQGASKPLQAQQILGDFHGDTGLATQDPPQTTAPPLHTEHLPRSPSWLCIAPLTNVAQALQATNPEHHTCFILGGTTKAGNIHGEEFNAYADPHAAKTVLESNAETTLLPINAVPGIPYSDAPTPPSTNPVRTAWNDLARRCDDADAPSIRPYDLVAAYLLHNPEAYRTEAHDVTVSTEPQTRGHIELHDGNAVNIVTSVDDNAAIKALRATLQTPINT